MKPREANPYSPTGTPDPVTPGFTREAKELLSFLYSVYGKVTLTGQHNQMFHMSEPSEGVARITGHYPLVWGGEWGFSDERHDIDNVKYRPKLLDQIREQHNLGRIICITYHQASPTVGEPCDFRGGVQVKITDEDWDYLLTEGTSLNTVWKEHVDRLAEAFQTLQDEHIPIIFRPYHEMNGDWFWWGGQPDRFLKLWEMIYSRYTQVHDLRNLLWAWNPDKPTKGVEKYFPGLSNLDLLGTDIYPDPSRAETYPQDWYERMKGLAGEKPLALSEMSQIPSEEELERQPWAWFMSWDNLVFSANTPEQMKVIFDSAKVCSERNP